MLAPGAAHFGAGLQAGAYRRPARVAEQATAPGLVELRARGIEGDVRLLLVLNEDGSLADVQIAVSSGHAILDNAAMKAAYAMGRLSGVTAREMILPVSFRLR